MVFGSSRPPPCLQSNSRSRGAGPGHKALTFRSCAGRQVAPSANSATDIRPNSADSVKIRHRGNSEVTGEDGDTTRPSAWKSASDTQHVPIAQSWSDAHWLTVLPGSLTIVPSTIRIVLLIASSSRYAMFSRSNSKHNKRNHSTLLRRRLSKATSEMSVQFASLTAYNRLPQRVTTRHMLQ